jgi:hypothetical protein
MEINQILSVSPNTHAKIKRWLDESMSRFEETNEVERKRMENKKVSRKKYAKPLTFAALKKSYPMHFLLFNVSDEILKRLKK